ncbi:hypothetical protein G6021_01925 [Dietzia sp. CW19]|uniref:hypothetical protein n=1 Tax=Dietzia sp. CW19 TaxID=1630634 RepID=UPI0015FE3D31|nr:hypothetical protein [Dietzia sp. CW19]MBB1049899.1 hypothetical protein [Dietzia sp. CW19]
MNTDEERQRAVAAIDAQIVALIEDGVPADASRIRALKAKRAVARKSKKAIKRSVRKARERQAAAAASATVAPAQVPQETGGRITLVPDSAADSQRLRSLPDKERKRIETARMEVRQTLTWCEEPSAEGVRNAIARCDAEISALIDRGADYEADARTQLRNRRARLKDLAAAFASRRRKSHLSELELAFLLDAYLERRRQISRGPENVVGVLDVRSGGAPSLGKRK